MKWTNRGNEFIRYQKIFKNKDILIYGNGSVGQELFEKSYLYKNNIVGWIDKKGGTYCGLNVYKYSDLDESILENVIIIIAANKPYETLFEKQLQAIGLEENKNYFRYSIWEEKYKYVYNVYRNEKVEVAFCGLQISNVCNLDCKGCLSFTHYIKKKCFYGKDYLEKNIKGLFEYVDFVDMLELCGGEPLLIPDVHELYEYVGKNYGDKIGLISTVTNATIVPTDKLCEVLKRYHIKVFLDDYRNSVHRVNETFSCVYEKFLKFGVDVEIRKVDSWIDLGITTSIKKSEKESLLRHSECSNNRMSLIDGKLFFCDYECYADMAGVFEADESDYINVYSDKPEITTIQEFILGYSIHGYCSMCSYCNGDGKVNTNLINVAEQYEK